MPDKAASGTPAKSGTERVTCEPQEFERVVKNLLNMPHKAHAAGEKTKGATPKGSPISSLSKRKGSGK